MLVIAAGLVIQPFQLALVRLLEGYGWSSRPIGSVFHAVGVELQWRRQARLRMLAGAPLPSYGPWLTPWQRRKVTRRRQQQWNASRAVPYELASYPGQEEYLLPTRLGNALRAAELQAGQRYGLNTIDVWPRLLPNLSPRVTEIITDLRNQLTPAPASVLSWCLPLASTALLAVHGPWLLIPAVTAVSSWIAYRAAARCDRPRPSALRRLRLHRFELLRGLHLPLPVNSATEEQVNRNLSRFFARWGDAGARLTVERYDHQSDRPKS